MLLFLISAVFTLLIMLASTSTVLHVGIGGLSLISFFMPFGNKSVDLTTCAEEAEKMNATNIFNASRFDNNIMAYEFSDSKCRIAYNIYGSIFREDESNRKVYVKYVSPLNSTQCPTGIPQPLRDTTEIWVWRSCSRWCKWSACDNAGTCGGGVQRRSYFTTFKNETSIVSTLIKNKTSALSYFHEWEERRYCNDAICPKSPRCVQGWSAAIRNKEYVCAKNCAETGCTDMKDVFIE